MCKTFDLLDVHQLNNKQDQFQFQRMNYQCKRFSHHGTIQRGQQDHCNNFREIRRQAGYHDGKKCFGGIVASQFNNSKLSNYLLSFETILIHSSLVFFFLSSFEKANNVTFFGFGPKPAFWNITIIIHYKSVTSNNCDCKII